MDFDVEPAAFNKSGPDPVNAAPHWFVFGFKAPKPGP
jgi:hypothetical protein